MPRYVVIRPHVDAQQRELSRGDKVGMSEKDAAPKLKRGMLATEEQWAERQAAAAREAPENAASQQAPNTKGGQPKSAKSAKTE